MVRDVPLVFAGWSGGGLGPWDPLVESLVAQFAGPLFRLTLILAIVTVGLFLYFAAEEGRWRWIVGRLLRGVPGVSMRRGPRWLWLWLAAVLVWAWVFQVCAGGGGGGDMPWDPLLDALVANIGGRTLRNILILAIVMAGIGFYFAESGGWVRTACALVIGFSIAAAAATWGPTFFGVTAAATRTPVPLRALHWTDWVSVALRLGTWMAVVTVGWWRLTDWWSAWAGHTPPPVA